MSLLRMVPPSHPESKPCVVVLMFSVLDLGFRVAASSKASHCEEPRCEESPSSPMHRRYSRRSPDCKNLWVVFLRTMGSFW